MERRARQRGGSAGGRHHCRPSTSELPQHHPKRSTTATPSRRLAATAAVTPRMPRDAGGCRWMPVDALTIAVVALLLVLTRRGGPGLSDWDNTARTPSLVSLSPPAGRG